MEMAHAYITGSTNGMCNLCGRDALHPIHTMPVEEYKKYGVDVHNLNPDGSDFHIMNTVDEEITKKLQAIIDKSIQKEIDKAIGEDLQDEHPDGPLRKRLPQRRTSLSFEFEHTWDDGQAFKYRATVGYYEDGTIGELFLNSSKRIGTALDANARDAAIFVSIALQYGAPLDVLRKAQARSNSGYPSSPVGMALDLIVERELINCHETPRASGVLIDSLTLPHTSEKGDGEHNKD